MGDVMPLFTGRDALLAESRVHGDANLRRIARICDLLARGHDASSPELRAEIEAQAESKRRRAF